MASTSQDQHLQGSIVPTQRAPRPMEPGVTIGHVHLRTSDIDRIRGFYVDVLGFDVIMEARDVPGWGTTGDMLFVSAGGYHHHLGFNTWKSAGGPPQPDGVTGLHHGGVQIRAALDHGTHEAVYLLDPDGNTLELAWDRPFDQWIPFGDPAAP